ncbi:glycosyltransferase [Halomonas sp. HNIBRBA4712]|uniref:glycosyltransferase family 2 protein n=1 Tax=Halomonas sp. HNIBRBA4712 TaxID=3373087 RepID=UPI0037470C46
MTDITLFEQSPWFDADWYQTQYPDVIASGLTPIEHYATLGEKWGRWAGPFFHSGFYRNQYPDISKAGVSPLLHYTKHGEGEGRWPFELAAQRLEIALWQDKDKHVLLRLNELIRSGGDWEASYAHWALARWYAWRQEWEISAHHLKERYSLSKQLPATPAPYLLEVEVLVQRGALAQALACISTLAERYPDYSDTHLAIANLLYSQLHSNNDIRRVSELVSGQKYALNEQLRLYHINAIYRAASLEMLALARDTQPLTLDNLTAIDAPSGDQHDDELILPLVTVIMPLFNAESYLVTAVESLQKQTYKNIEVLIIDDASTDSSPAIAQTFCDQDERFRLIRQPGNQGAYAARNRGLELARGELITVHDSDDWSHPQKLECQVHGLNQHPNWKACFSDFVRATTELRFSRWRIENMDGWVYRNTSSLMFRREVFETLGFWDAVNVGADGEYFQRIMAAWGPQAYGTVKKGIPLCFGRSLPQSLSQAGPTHLVTQFKGLRYDYQQAFAQWHSTAEKPSDLYMPQHPKVRPFPAPQGNLRT